MATPLFSDDEFSPHAEPGPASARPAPLPARAGTGITGASPSTAGPAACDVMVTDVYAVSGQCGEAYRRLREAQLSGDPRAIGAAQVSLELALAVARWSSIAGVRTRAALPGRPGPASSTAEVGAAARPAPASLVSGLEDGGPTVDGDSSGGSAADGRNRSRRWSGLLTRSRVGGRSRL